MQQNKRLLTWCLGVVALAMLGVSVYLPHLARTRRQAADPRHLSVVGMALFKYVQEHEGRYPSDLEILIRQGYLPEAAYDPIRSTCKYRAHGPRASEMPNNVIIAYVVPFAGARRAYVLLNDGNVIDVPVAVIVHKESDPGTTWILTGRQDGEWKLVRHRSDDDN